MLLTITTTHRPATDLGELLRADPDDVRSKRFDFGEALVFFPQYDESRCTAAVLVQPGGEGSVAEASASPSSLAIVLATVFEQTIRARTAGVPAAARPLPLEVQIPAFPVPVAEDKARCLFEPLGYTAGAGADGSLWLFGTVPLADLLTHLCVLLPMLDDDPLPMAHEAVDRLLATGGPWIGAHPECARIARRLNGTTAGNGSGGTGPNGSTPAFPTRYGSSGGGPLCTRRASA